MRTALFPIAILVLVFLPVTAAGHSMGEAVPIAFVEGPSVEFAANVIAGYFGEQMGREIQLVPKGSIRGCLDLLRSGKAPMAVLEGMPEKNGLNGIVVLNPVLVVGGQVKVLVMGDKAAKMLQFSLVPMYLEKLGNGLSPGDWDSGLERVRSGKGVRKVALEMLRAADLL